MCLYLEILVVWIGRLNHLAVRTHSPSSHHLHFQEIVQAFAHCTCIYWGDCGSTVVKVLCYKSKGRWFDRSWCQWIFH